MGEKICGAAIPASFNPESMWGGRSHGLAAAALPLFYTTVEACHRLLTGKKEI